MKFALTPEQELLRQSVREFAEAEVKPLARELDRTGRFPRETLRKAAELGLIGVSVPEEEGGAGADHVSYSILIEEISRACASTGVILSVQNSLFCDPLHRFGTAEQKKRFLAPYVRGEKLGCYALTEPQAGSNAAALRTSGRAARRPLHRQRHQGLDHLRRRGRRRAGVREHRSGAKRKRHHRAAHRTRHARLPGRQGRRESWASTPRRAPNFPSPTAKCPSENRLGAEGEGYKIALATLDGGRIGIASQAIGIAQGAFEQALAYSKERQAFGHPIAKFQAIQFMLADMATEIDAARMLARHAAWKQDSGVRFSLEASIAKLFASEMATRVTHKAIQIHGGNGYSREYPVERMYRDARITEIYEGTSEIQRLVIASWVLRQS